MSVSENGYTPQMAVLMGNLLIHHQIWGCRGFRRTQICVVNMPDGDVVKRDFSISSHENAGWA